MRLRLKKLCAACALVMALTATTASVASAAEYRHEAAGEKARFMASNEGAHKFALGLVGTLSCNTASLSGTEHLPSPQPEIEFDPAFSGCTFLGASNVAVNMNGCRFKLGIPKPINMVEWAVSVSIVCPVGQKITFTAFGCTIEIGGQGGLQLSVVTNLITKRIRIKFQVTSLTYTASVLCPGASGTHSNGTYEGVAMTSAENEFEEVVGAYIE